MWIGILEYRIAGNKRIGAGSCKQFSGLNIHAAIDLNKRL
jgi:hypothetical protein